MKREELITLCKSLGVLLLDQGDSISVDAPVGKVIKSSDSHSITLSKRGWKMDVLYADIADDLRAGLIDCDDADCDACIHEPMDFDAIQALYRGERLAP